MNSLTFGNVQNFYSDLFEKQQNSVSKDFSNQFYKDYGKRIHISPEVMIKANHNFKFF